MPHDPTQPALFEQIARFLKRIADGFRWLDEHPEALRRFEAEVRHRQRDDNAWRYLFDRVNGVTALSMQIGLVAERRLGQTRPGRDGVVVTARRDGRPRAPRGPAAGDRSLNGVRRAPGPNSSRASSFSKAVGITSPYRY